MTYQRALVHEHLPSGLGPQRALAFLRENRQRFVSDLKTFLRFPSVSSNASHARDVLSCARWLASHLRQIGFDAVQIVPTERHPIVYAERLHAPGRPTVLVYGHYDVQPADPLREWTSPPFNPSVRGNEIFARGASDDKGQMFTHVKAMESYLRTEGRLPVNIKCIFEGEEEIGSPNLGPFLMRNSRRLAADVAVLSDTPMLAADKPAIHYAVRGGLYFELTVRGPGHDLHSGNFGGAIHNPLQALSGIIATLHDPQGRVAIPGFYDRVQKPSPRERSRMAGVAPPDRQILKDAKATLGWGERGFTLHERITLRPALTINGIIGGYSGPGVKGVIPAQAIAKLSFRLVPDQKPHEIEKLFRYHIARVTPGTVRCTIHTLSSTEPALIDPTHPAMRAAATAYTKSFGVKPVFLRSGGTIPIVSMLRERVRIPTVLMGFALPDDRMHAPNEKFHLANFFRGIATCIWFLREVGARHEREAGRQNMDSGMTSWSIDE